MTEKMHYSKSLFVSYMHFHKSKSTISPNDTFLIKHHWNLVILIFCRDTHWLQPFQATPAYVISWVSQNNDYEKEARLFNSLIKTFLQGHSLITTFVGNSCNLLFPQKKLFYHFIIFCLCLSRKFLKFLFPKLPNDNKKSSSQVIQLDHNRKRKQEHSILYMIWYHNILREEHKSIR